VLQLRIAYRLHAAVGDRLAEGARQQPAHHFVLDLLGKARPHHLRRHLPRPEAGNLGLAAELVGDAAGLRGDEVGGDLDLDGFFDGGKILIIKKHYRLAF
jgi:hypothetical protein